MACKSTDTLQRQIIERTFNLLSKILRYPPVAPELAKQKHLVFKTILYMSKEFAGALQENAIRTLYPLCKVPEFSKICFEDHKFTRSTFNNYVKEIQLLFHESIETGKEDWAVFTNVCSSLVAFITAFPDRNPEFRAIIPELIKVVKDKTEVVRKNGAILLAKLAADEENNKLIRENHGFDVLMSLRGAL